MIMMHWQGNYEDNDDGDAGDENDANIIGNIDDQSGDYGMWRMTDDNFVRTALFVCLQFYSELLKAKSQLHNKCVTNEECQIFSK